MIQREVPDKLIEVMLYDPIERYQVAINVIDDLSF
jgi:hypothetical protein